MLRSGIKFQDGEPLNADAVKQNIDAWRKGVLLGFVFKNIADVTTQGDDTVIVTMTDPWVAFPAYLWTQRPRRDRGAGPAQRRRHVRHQHDRHRAVQAGSFDPTTGDVKVVRNPDYWRKGFPYLDGINFKPQEDSSQRIRGLQGGQFDITHDAGGLDLSEIQSTMPSAEIWNEPNGRMEVAHLLPNVTRAPLDDLTARKAIAMAVDRNRLNEISNKGTSRLADQIFDTDVMGHVDGLKYPAQNVDAGEEAGPAVQERARRQVRVRDPVDVRHHDPAGGPGDGARARAGRHHGEAAEPGGPGHDHQPGHRWCRGRLQLAQLSRPGPGHDVRVVLRRLRGELQPHQRPAAQRRPRQGPDELGHRRRAPRPTRTSTSG